MPNYYLVPLLLVSSLMIPSMVMSQCYEMTRPMVITDRTVHISDIDNTYYLAFKGYISHSGGNQLRNWPIKLKPNDTLSVQRDRDFNLTVKAECAQLTFMIKRANTPGKHLIDGIVINHGGVNMLARIRPWYPEFDSTEYFFCHSEHRFALERMDKGVPSIAYEKALLVILELILEIDGDPEDIVRGSNTKRKIKCPAMPAYYQSS